MNKRTINIFLLSLCLIFSLFGCGNQQKAAGKEIGGVILGDYKNIEVTVGKSVITDSTVQSYIERMIENYVSDEASKPTFDELTDEFVATQMTDTECKTVEELKQKVSDYLNGLNDYYAENNTRSAIEERLVEICTVKKISEDLLAERVAFQEKVFKVNCSKQYGLDFEEYLKNYQITEKDFHEQTVTTAKEKLRSELILKAIAECENITVKDDEIKKYAEEMLENYGYENIEELYSDYGETYIKSECLCDKVLESLMKKAKVTFVAPGNIPSD